MKRRLKDVVLVTTGFILSPLSWWNDMVINVPLAYVFSFPFSLIDPQLFLPSFILGYWLSNLLGFLMLHWGGESLIHHNHKTISIKRSLIISIIYSIIVIIMVLLDWISPPIEMLELFQQGMTHA